MVVEEPVGRKAFNAAVASAAEPCIASHFPITHPARFIRCWWCKYSKFLLYTWGRAHVDTYYAPI